MYSPVWWGRILEMLASKQLASGVEDALDRLKKAAEDLEVSR